MHDASRTAGVIKRFAFVLVPEISMANTVADRKATAKVAMSCHLVGKRIYLKNGIVFQRNEEIPNVNSMLQMAVTRKNVLTALVDPQLSDSLYFIELSRNNSMNKQNIAVCNT